MFYSSSFAEVIVADNCSTDDSIIFLQTKFPSVRIIQNANNGGFAKGYNDALKKVEAEYYVLLNSDVEVTQGWIDPVIKLMDSDKTIAACQPKLIAFHNKKQTIVVSTGIRQRIIYPCFTSVCSFENIIISTYAITVQRIQKQHLVYNMCCC